MKTDSNKKLSAIKMYKLSELVPILGVTQRTLLSYVYSGRLKAVKIGNSWRVTEENLQHYIENGM